jgi:thioredoxin 1
MATESTQAYDPDEPTRDEVDHMQGPVLLNFGTDWCGYCRAVAPQLNEQLKAHPEVRHIKVEDGKGKPLGRSFRVKLWPTLVFMHDGTVVWQVSRPGAREIRDGFEALARRV